MSPLVKERLLTTLQYGIPLGLVLALFVALATPSKRYEVLCEKRDGQRAVQVVRTHIRDHLADVLGRGGGHNQLDIRFVDGDTAHFLTSGSKTHNSDPNLLQMDRVCAISVVTQRVAIVAPIIVDPINWERFGIVRLPDVGYSFRQGDGSVLILGQGRNTRKYFQMIALPGDNLGEVSYRVGGQELLPWMTRELLVQDNRIIATQAAISADRIAKARAMPGDTAADDEVRNYAKSYAEQWAYGDVWRDKSLRVDYKRYPDLAPVVERRLVSTDDGKSWSLLDWRLLRPEVVPAGAQLQRIEPQQ